MSFSKFPSSSFSSSFLCTDQRIIDEENCKEPSVSTSSKNGDTCCSSSNGGGGRRRLSETLLYNTCDLKEFLSSSSSSLFSTSSASSESLLVQSTSSGRDRKSVINFASSSSLSDLSSPNSEMNENIANDNEMTNLGNDITVEQATDLSTNIAVGNVAQQSNTESNFNEDPDEDIIFIKAKKRIIHVSDSMPSAETNEDDDCYFVESVPPPAPSRRRRTSHRQQHQHRSASANPECITIEDEPTLVNTFTTNGQLPQDVPSQQNHDVDNDFFLSNNDQIPPTPPLSIVNEDYFSNIHFYNTYINNPQPFFPSFPSPPSQLQPPPPPPPPPGPQAPAPASEPSLALPLASSSAVSSLPLSLHPTHNANAKNEQNSFLSGSSTAMNLTVPPTVSSSFWQTVPQVVEPPQYHAATSEANTSNVVFKTRILPGFVCSICFGSNLDDRGNVNDNNFFSTNCGHIYCNECLNALFKQKPQQCAVCRRRMNRRQARRIYIS